MSKRAFDLVLALASLALLSPLLLLAAALIVLDSRGPVLYRGERVGRGGVGFRMFKLRTMVPNADCIGPALTGGHDPRVTRLGRFLRQWKIDEIPQLLNVLRGEMSMVGPRPEAPCYVAHYSAEQRRVLSVRPGITGLSQLAFRHEEALLEQCEDLEEEYVSTIMPRKLEIDLRYVDSQSLLLDLRLVLRTLLVLFSNSAPSQALVESRQGQEG